MNPKSIMHTTADKPRVTLSPHAPVVADPQQQEIDRITRELHAAQFRASYLQHCLRAAVRKLDEAGLLDEMVIEEWAGLVGGGKAT